MYRVERVAKLLLLTCCFLTCFFIMKRSSISCKKQDWHDYEAMKKDSLKTGPGEQGVAYRPLITGEAEKNLQDSLYRSNGYNAYVSDRLPLYRSIKDTRPAVCRSKTYCNHLPKTSVIMPFHNEHLSVILRSVYSILRRTPISLLEEIILVDDASTKQALKKPLTDYLKTRRLAKVRIVKAGRQNGQREGLIRAKVKGAKAAVGQALVFLDVHSEVGYNWLPPLLDLIARNRRTVASPFIDVIDCDTFEIRSQGNGARGMFNWKFEFKNVPAVNNTPGEPFDNPVMAGGYFAIDRQWFEQLGWYDEELMIWGGEQYELSFKIWQCHGRLVDVPCSHVAHIYRCKHVPFSNPNIGDFLARNYKRVAEVWMDEYKEHLYRRQENFRRADAGDLTNQLAVRQRLKCNSFKWFVDNVMYDQKEWYPPVEPTPLMQGYLLNPSSNLCLFISSKRNTPVEMIPCQVAKVLQLDIHFSIREMDGSACLDASSTEARVLSYGCHKLKGNQHWTYDNRTIQLYQPTYDKCLTIEDDGVFIRQCQERLNQQWLWQT